ncbi:MAG: tetratricopeptide repeat protein [Elusimicrobiota bacterium]
MTAQEKLPAGQAAQARADLGDYPGAEELLAGALKTDPRDAQALLLLAQVVRDRPHEALRHAERAARLLEDGPAPRRAGAYRLAGEIRTDLGDYAGARAEFQRALRLDGDDLAALQALTRIELELQRPSEASRYARQALRAAENAPHWLRPAAYEVSARIWLELKDEARASESLRLLLEIDPDELGALAALVQLEKRQAPRDPATASGPIPDDRQFEDRSWTVWTQEALARARQKAPGGLETLRLLIARSDARARPDEAAAFADRLAAAIKEAPLWQRAAAHRLSARIWQALGDQRKAMKSAQQASHLEPESLQTLQLLASDTMELVELERHQKLLIITDITGHIAGVLEHSAQLWHELKDDVRAQARFKQALAAASPAPTVEGLRMSAQLRLKHKDHDGARRDLTQLLLLAQGDTHALQLLAQLALDDARPEEAVDYARRASAALEEEPSSNRPALYRQAARIHLGLKDAAAAEDDLQRLLQLAPDDLQALQALAQLELDRDRPREALAYADRLAASLQAPPAERAAAHRQAARIRLELKEDPGAARSLLQALTLAPQDPQTLRALVQLELDGGRPAQALGYARRLVGALGSSSPAELVEAHRQSAGIRLALKDDAGAQRDLLRALKIAPDDRRTLQLLTQAALRQGRRTQARAYASRLTDALEKAAPEERVEAYRQSARMHRQLKDAAGTENDLTRLLQLAPGDPEALQTLAQSELEAGRPREARAYADRLAGALENASPAERAAAYRQSARIHLALKDDAGAESDLQRTLELAPDDRQALQLLAQGKQRLGRPQEALTFAQRLTGASEKAPPAERAAGYRLSAGIRFDLKDDTGAQRDLLQALALAPGDLAVLRSLIQAKRKQPQEAAALLSKHWPADPRPRARWLALRGLTRLWTEDLAGARGDFEAAAAIDAAAFCSDDLFQTDRDSLDALYFEVCLRRFPKDPALYADRGIARYRAGLKDAALADLRKATELKVDFPEAFLSLALVLAEQGRPEAALEAVDLAVKNATDRQSGAYGRLLSLQSALRGERPR